MNLEEKLKAKVGGLRNELINYFISELPPKSPPTSFNAEIIDAVIKTYIKSICQEAVDENNTKLEIAKEMCNKIIRHWEVDRIFIKDPFQECYELAKETLSKLPPSPKENE